MAPPVIAVGHAENMTTGRTCSLGVVLRIADTGVGMPAEVIGSIFEPFFTTKEIGKGTGLGLALTRRLVEAQGGSVGVRSAPGVGLPMFACTGRPEAAASRRTAFIEIAANRASRAWVNSCMNARRVP